MKFLNKKEQVIDLKLTTYGHHLLSVGTFKPVYYAFFDDNVIYDGLYAGITESQSSVVDRIKNKTQYLEGQTLFTDLQDRPSNARSDAAGRPVPSYALDITPTKETLRRNVLRYDKPIGDAHLDGQQLNFAPGWKIVLLNGQITSNTQRDSLNKLEIPQIDISLDYKKKIQEPGALFDSFAAVEAVNETYTFVDGNTIALKSDDPVIYVEELNTNILTNNFDIEIFEIMTSSYIDSSTDTVIQGTSSYIRKYFEKEVAQIVDGIMRMPNPIEKFHEQIPSSSVEYYFDIRTDSQVDLGIACRGMEIYNRKSYYIDLDFDCAGTEQENIYYDIYGSDAEPEICLD